jgi:hypothetical protein
MKNKAALTIDELLVNESFLNFYFRKYEADILEWEDWAENHTERQDLIKQAFGHLDKLSLKWKKEYIADKFEEMNENLEEAIALKISYRRPQIIRWVAVVILFLGIGWWYLQQKTSK